jgi:hypothetical protein
MKEIEARTVCPSCGHEHEFCSPVTGDRLPKDGDVSVCIDCLAVNIFCNSQGTLSLRKPTPEEAQAIASDSRLQAALAAHKAGRDVFVILPIFRSA